MLHLITYHGCMMPPLAELLFYMSLTKYEGHKIVNFKFLSGGCGFGHT